MQDQWRPVIVVMDRTFQVAVPIFNRIVPKAQMEVLSAVDVVVLDSIKLHVIIHPHCISNEDIQLC